jgi:hypothetical protein
MSDSDAINSEAFVEPGATFEPFRVEIGSVDEVEGEGSRRFKRTRGGRQHAWSADHQPAPPRTGGSRLPVGRIMTKRSISGSSVDRLTPPPSAVESAG